MADVRADIDAERARQDEKWGPQDHMPLRWLAILGEEYGECSKAVLEYRLQELRTELVQVAAVAIAFVESLDRNELNPAPLMDDPVEGDW